MQLNASKGQQNDASAKFPFVSSFSLFYQQPSGVPACPRCPGDGLETAFLLLLSSLSAHNFNGSHSSGLAVL